MPFPLIAIDALPWKTDRTLRAVPYVTYGLCFLNLFIYLGHLTLSHYELAQVQQSWGFAILHPTLPTLVSHAFLHGDIGHLVGNLLLLWLVGTVLEAGIGSLLFALLYFASLVTAVLLYTVVARAIAPGAELVLIGASGAIAGVTGLAAFRYYRLRVFTIPLLSFTFAPVLPVPVPLWVPLWSYAVIFAGREVLAGVQEVVTGANAGVAHWAHIGGLLLGALAAALTRAVPDAMREYALEDSVKATEGKAAPARSRREVEQLLWDRPDDPELLEALAGLLLATPQRERCRDLYRRAIPHFLAAGQPARAAISYLNLARAFPGAVLPLREQMVVANALESLDYPTEAAEAYLLAREHYPQQEDAQTALLRAAHIAARRLHDPARARILLQQLLATYPDTPWRQLAHERLRTLPEPDAPAPHP